ncbi:MAG: CPBP family intramembrane glutamic endopeptidase [Deltaproteobacteria bacterium]
MPGQMVVPPPTEPPSPVPGPGDQRLPGFAFFALVALLYVALGSVAQLWNLPFGLWWSQLFLFFLPTALLLRTAGFRPLRFLRLSRPPPEGSAWLVGAAAIATFVSASSLMAVCEIAAPQWLVERFDLSRVLDQVHGPLQIVLFASVVVGAPLAEETVFRGYLLPVFERRMGLGRAILAQALLFSLVHLDPIGFLPRLLLGAVFGWLVALTGSLWPGVFAHALNNGVSTYLYFKYGAGPEGEAAPANPWQALALSVTAGLVTAGLLAWLRRRHRPLPPSPLDVPAAGQRPLGRRETLRLMLGWGLGAALGLVLLGLWANAHPQPS